MWRGEGEDERVGGTAVSKVESTTFLLYNYDYLQINSEGSI